MSSILTHAIISNATQAVDTYITTVKGLEQELVGLMSTLTSENFNGDASDGFTVFYNEKVLPAISDNLTSETSLTKSIKSMLESIQNQLLDTVDPGLGENNRNPGAQA